MPTQTENTNLDQQALIKAIRELQTNLKAVQDLTTAMSLAELAVLDGVVAGTVAASKAVVVDANKDVTGFRHVTSEGSIKSSSASAGVGYATGAGGTVTQATNKSTGVTLDKVSGEIVTNAESLAAAAEVSFTVTNAQVAATDVVIVNHASVGTLGAYNVEANGVAAGSFKITIANLSAGALAEAIKLNFAVIKAVAA